MERENKYINYVNILKHLVASALLPGNKKACNCKENWANYFISCLNTLQNKQDRKDKL